MTVFVWKLLENTNCIYLSYRVSPDLPKNKSFKAVFDNDGMIPSTQNGFPGTFLVVQWLRLCAPDAGGPG